MRVDLIHGSLICIIIAHMQHEVKGGAADYNTLNTPVCVCYQSNPMRRQKNIDFRRLESSFVLLQTNRQHCWTHLAVTMSRFRPFPNFCGMSKCKILVYWMCLVALIRRVVGRTYFAAKPV